MTTAAAASEPRYLRIIAFVEGLTLVALVFIGMPLKHLFGIGTANAIFGPTHGVVFLAYAAVVLVVFFLMRRSFDWLVMAMLASIIPGGTFWFFSRRAEGEPRAS